MNQELSAFATRLRGIISSSVAAGVTRLQFKWNGNSGCRFQEFEPPHVGCHERFDAHALELFALQFQNNPAYRKICLAKGATPEIVEYWTQIPAVPSSAFKELELSCIPPGERTAVFHSSGTTDQKPGRHFHCAESLAVYQASLWEHFQFSMAHCRVSKPGQLAISNWQLAILTPPPEQAPHSSLVHMFETVRRKLGALESAFVGRIA
ncbi:MAG TPA: hypothetical protein VFY06_04675, partial [Verrucomicrobiae bacterium]|nr:hypothetical protein [Verrucomicrobiae bacterium]